MSADVRYFGCNLCEALCGLRVTVEDGRISDIRGDDEDVFSRGHICPKGPAMREIYEDPDRLRAPVRRTAKGWEPIGWDEALDEAGERLGAIRDRHGKDAVGMYFGNPVAHGHRAVLGVQALNLALGSKNVFDANSQDSNPRLFACMEMYGDVLSVPVPDVDRTDFLLMLGANPAVSGGSIMALGDVKGRLRGIRERGGRVVLIDPRRNETADWCDAHHFIRPGGDAPLLLAMLHVLFVENLVDREQVRRGADGLDTLEKLARAYSPERVAEAVGISAATIGALARELAAAPRACVYGRIGTSLNPFGPVASWLVDALNVVTGTSIARAA